MKEQAPAGPDGATVDPLTFRHVLGRYPTGVCVVAAADGDGRVVGMTVGSFTSVSLDPPLIAFCPDRRSRRWARMRTAATFSVNVLAGDQEAMCRHFSVAAQDGPTGVAHRRSPLGAPILDGVLAWIECSLEAEHEAGDHFIVVGRVSRLQAERQGTPLLFLGGGYGSFVPFASDGG